MVKKNSNLMKCILFTATLLFVVTDQVTKFLVEKILPKDTTISIIPSVLHLTYVKNYGAAFGILQNQKFFLLGVTSIILIGIIIFLFFKEIKSGFLLWALVLIISGGIGNLIDRVFRGYVIDFIDFRLINFAVFNLADSYVCIGVFLIIIYILFIDASYSINKKGNYCKWVI